MQRHQGSGEHGVKRESKAHRGWGEVSQGRMAEKRAEVGRPTACRGSWPMVQCELYGVWSSDWCLGWMHREVTGTPEGWHAGTWLVEFPILK